MPVPISRLCSLIAAAAALGGCDASADEFAEGSRAAPIELSAEGPPDPRLCDQLEREADMLIASSMTCEGDVDCEAELGTLVSADPCLPQLVCWMPISTSDRVDLGVVLDRLQNLDAEYREVCGTCPTPVCADPEVVASTCERRGCALDVVPPPDDMAGLAAPSSGAPATQ